MPAAESSRTSAMDSLEAALADVPRDLAAVLTAVADTGREISRLVRRARIEDIVGEAGDINVQGEVQQKLDVLANQMLIDAMTACPSVAVCASEEEDEALVVRTASEGGAYSVLFDPLDGSSNIDVAVGIGTIFSVLANGEADDETAGSVLAPGHEQVAAGYVLFGSQVALVLCAHRGVDMFVLDPETDAFVRVLKDIEIPAGKKTYSINEAYAESFPDYVQRYLAQCHAEGYAARYIGSMVADVHRTLIKGGVFLYPETASNPDGKLRLMYEANPMALLVERAGGAASTGRGRILDVDALKVHQRTPVLMGAADEVERILAHRSPS